jgi:ribosomal protein S18 acetylase RimI-like enzyme
VTDELGPARTLGGERLLQLFNAAYSDYYVPIELNDDAFDAIVELWDIDLDASRVIGDNAFAFLAARGDRGWIGGMGAVPSARRRGLGERVLHAVIDEARARGLHEISLEVLVQNIPARRLYEKLGFEPVRELEIWELDAVNGIDVDEIPVDDALRAIAARRTAAEPWQRADETVAHMRERGAQLAGLGTDTGAAVLTTGGARRQLLQLAAADPQPLVAAAAPFVWLNVPADDLAAAALHALNGRVTERQLEMVLHL